MDINVSELGLDSLTEVKQLIEIGDKDIFVEAVRPHIYKHNAPAGTITITIKDEAEAVTLGTSNVITITDISAIAFFHGVVRFDINAGLTKNTKYNIILSSSGYTFAEAAYVGWCTDFDLKIVDRDYTPSTGFNAALHTELWERRTLKRGIL